MTDANDEALLRRLVATLSTVPGVAAIALGGSRARGTATAHSDYDIGLYYRASRPIDVAALGKVAAGLDDRGAEATVTPIGGWGPWIDGGVYLLNEKGAVATVDGFALSPPDFAKRVTHLFADLGSGECALGLDRLEALVGETKSLSSAA